ncbi:class I SAM-dependent methyltransferase [Spirillospora sp. NBC_00431]
MYEADLAENYDLIYASRGKDYASESATVTKLIRDRNPRAADVLDVACGTGSHLRHLRRIFDRVEGLEKSKDMIRVAGGRIPGVRVHEGDMRDFRLGRRYDAITCLFSSIGYLPTAADLNRTLRAMARHLRPGGVIVIEPWVFPESFIQGYVAGDIARSGDRTVLRVSHSPRHGDRVPMDVHYLVADPEYGIRHFTDTHELTLFPREAYEAAFTEAGCDVEYVRASPFTLGLFVGARPPATRPATNRPG